MPTQPSTPTLDTQSLTSEHQHPPAEQVTACSTNGLNTPPSSHQSTADAPKDDSLEANTPAPQDSGQPGSRNSQTETHTVHPRDINLWGNTVTTMKSSASAKKRSKATSSQSQTSYTSSSARTNNPTLDRSISYLEELQADPSPGNLPTNPLLLKIHSAVEKTKVIANEVECALDSFNKKSKAQIKSFREAGYGRYYALDLKYYIDTGKKVPTTINDKKTDENGNVVAHQRTVERRVFKAKHYQPNFYDSETLQKTAHAPAWCPESFPGEEFFAPTYYQEEYIEGSTPETKSKNHKIMKNIKEKLIALKKRVHDHKVGGFFSKSFVGSSFDNAFDEIITMYSSFISELQRTYEQHMAQLETNTLGRHLAKIVSANEGLSDENSPMPAQAEVALIDKLEQSIRAIETETRSFATRLNNVIEPAIALESAVLTGFIEEDGGVLLVKTKDKKNKVPVIPYFRGAKGVYRLVHVSKGNNQETTQQPQPQA